MRKKDIKKYLVVLFIFFLVLGISIQTTAKEQKRALVEKKDTNLALEQGCKLVKGLKHVDILNCEEGVISSLNLQEDLPVFALDANANTQIRANLVQDAGNTGVGRKVVVVDTGYNYLHPELSSSYLGGYDFVNNDNDPIDDNGHGSHVAGLITADGINSNAKGVSPNTGIFAAKVLNSAGSGYFSDVIESIYWSVDGNDGIYGTSDDLNADAISMSLGTSSPYTYKGYCDNVLPSLTNAINYAVSKNVNVVSAAGNSGNAGISIPGCISNSITVGSVDGTDKIVSFSGRGKALDVVAPGVSLLSSWLGSSYVTASGTSMATPVVSGTVALIKYQHPTYTVTQVRNALIKTAKDLGKRGFDTSYGYGRVDAYSAVNYVGSNSSSGNGLGNNGKSPN